jgi:hypothetical protein
MSVELVAREVGRFAMKALPGVLALHAGKAHLCEKHSMNLSAGVWFRNRYSGKPFWRRSFDNLIYSSSTRGKPMVRWRQIMLTNHTIDRY